MSFTTEMILEDLASFGEMSRRDWAMRHDGPHDGGYTFRCRNDKWRLVSVTRPEGLKDDIEAVIDERPAWTMNELCERLSLPLDMPTKVSVGRTLKELDVKSIRGRRDTKVYGRGTNLDVATKLALEVAASAARWTTSELLGVLGWPVNRSTQTMLGRALIKGGWIRTTNPVESNRIAVYKKALASTAAPS
jgi:hypothetical protein